MIYDIIIIGAGAAGLFAAANAKINQKILLLEKMRSAGKKLLISGSGRCNITHQGNIREFFNKYGTKKNFISPVLKSFTNTELIQYFEERGLEFYIDKNGKYFPKTDSSSDILNILLEQIQKRKVDIRYNQSIVNITKNENGFQVHSAQFTEQCKNLILCCGGKSYPSTGSDGSGYELAKQLGHSIIEPQPALSPIYIKDFPLKDLSGVSLPQCKITNIRNNIKIAENTGEMVITHFGISGPAVLDISRYIKAEDTLKLNFINKSKEVFEQELIEYQREQPKSAVKSIIRKYSLPESLILRVLSLLNIDPALKMSEISKVNRKNIAEAFAEFTLQVYKKGNFNTAMATAGGVSTDEVNPKTLESKIIPNLYFAGEILDIDGDSGGYNLQFAFSSAFLAINSIINKK